jgi:hypothetical protein
MTIEGLHPMLEPEVREMKRANWMMPLAAGVVAGCAVGDDATTTETVGTVAEAANACFSVTAVEHDTVAFRVRTQFIVRGHGLPDTIAFHIDQCRDKRLESISADRTMATFSCVPDYSLGEKAGVVKPYAGAPLQFTFMVDVEDVE